MINLTDDLLRAAAADVRNAMLDALPALEECRHTFSPQFERKMQKLIRKQKAGYRLLRQVAAVFLALLVGSGVWRCGQNLSAPLSVTPHLPVTAVVSDQFGHSVLGVLRIDQRIHFVR